MIYAFIEQQTTILSWLPRVIQSWSPKLIQFFHFMIVIPDSIAKELCFFWLYATFAIIENSFRLFLFRWDSTSLADIFPEVQWFTAISLCLYLSFEVPLFLKLCASIFGIHQFIPLIFLPMICNHHKDSTFGLVHLGASYFLFPENHTQLLSLRFVFSE